MNATKKLPAIGRPSVTGLSVKLLGVREYNRQYQRRHTPRVTARRWWSNLSPKLMGQVNYVAAWRKLQKETKS